MISPRFMSSCKQAHACTRVDFLLCEIVDARVQQTCDDRVRRGQQNRGKQWDDRVQVLQSQASHFYASKKNLSELCSTLSGWSNALDVDQEDFCSSQFQSLPLASCISR